MPQMLNRRRIPRRARVCCSPRRTTAAARIFMRTDLFVFDLPPDRIALRPARPRDAARLMVARPGENPETHDRLVGDLPDLLGAGDQVVVNDTKVIPAALHGRRLGRTTEPKIEATLIPPVHSAALGALDAPAQKR